MEEEGSYGGAGWRELLQHVGDEDLEQSFSEEPLPHRAAVVVKLLQDKTHTHTHTICPDGE